MQSIGIGELQKNMGILTHLTEALTVVDKRKNREVAIICPVEKNDISIIETLGGKYNSYAKNKKHPESFTKMRDEAMMRAMKEKYDLPD
jgi:hypothetical protein